MKAAVFLIALTAGVTEAREVDPATGLTIAPGWEAVRTQCTVCHSARLIIQQRASADRWREMIRWMQATQGLWPLPTATEQKIVAYLAAAYPARGRSRRPPLPVGLLPPPADPTDGPEGR